MPSGVTGLDQIKDTLSLEELIDETILIAQTYSPITQEGEIVKVDGTYKVTWSLIPKGTKAKKGTETSIPAPDQIQPQAVLHKEPEWIEKRYDLTKLARLTTKDDLIADVKTKLGQDMGLAISARCFDELRGYGLTGVARGEEVGNCAITYTPKGTGFSASNFATNGTSGTVTRPVTVKELVDFAGYVRARYGMRNVYASDGQSYRNTNKISLLVPTPFISEVLNSATYNQWARYQDSQKFYNYDVGELGSLLVKDIQHVEFIENGAIASDPGEGGIKYDSTNGFYELFALGDRAFKQLIWEGITISIDEPAKEGKKVMYFVATWVGNFALTTGRATLKNEVNVIHFPVK